MSHIKMATLVVVMYTVSVIEYAYRTVISPCTTNWIHSLDIHQMKTRKIVQNV